MATIFTQIAITLTLISLSVQLKLVSKSKTEHLHHGLDFDRVTRHLERHPSNHHDKHHAKDFDANLLNIQNLNLYFNTDHKSKSPRSDALIEIDDENPEEIQQMLDELENEIRKIDNLRCSGDRCDSELRQGDRCGCRPRSDSQKIDDNSDEDRSLRCRNNRCSKDPSRTHKDLKSELERYGKKFKINDELDAIVLDLNNFNELLSKLKKIPKGQNTENNLTPDYYDRDGARPNYFKALILDEDSSSKSHESLEEKYNQKQNSDSSKLQKGSNTLNEAENQLILNRALNYIENKKGDNRLSVQKLKSVVQSHDVTAEDELREKIRNIVDNNFKSDDKVKIYVPSWQQRAMNNFNFKQRAVKNILPRGLKHKQKMRTNQSRKSGNQLGVPFELQVQGLGQVSP